MIISTEIIPGETSRSFHSVIKKLKMNTQTTENNILILHVAVFNAY